MGNNNLAALTEGYDGANKNNRAVADQGSAAQNLHNKHNGAAEEFLAKNKGAMGAQGGNVAYNTGAAFKAGGNTHVGNADRSSRHIKTFAAAEQEGTDRTRGAAGIVETTAFDIQNRANKQA